MAKIPPNERTETDINLLYSYCKPHVFFEQLTEQGGKAIAKEMKIGFLEEGNILVGDGEVLNQVSEWRGGGERETRMRAKPRTNQPNSFGTFFARCSFTLCSTAAATFSKVPITQRVLWLTIWRAATFSELSSCFGKGRVHSQLG